MEKIRNGIAKGDNVAVHVTLGDEIMYPVTNGINYNFDTVYLKYAEKYVGVMLTIIYRDANGHEKKESKALDASRVMSWMNDEPADEPNFGFVGFSCDTEIFFEFTFN